MGLATPTILQPAVINERISRLKLVNNTFQEFLGMQRGGPRVRQSPMGRRGAYDVFNATREVGNARLPGQTSGTIAPNPVGVVNFTIPRHHDNMPLLMEQLHNMRAIGGPVGQIDALGMQYIVDQEKYMAQRVTNIREFQVAAMLRGSYTYTVSGDDLQHGFSGGSVTIDYQIPSGNKTTLDMTGGGAIISTNYWSSVGTTIIDQLYSINAAFIELVGRGLRHVWVSSVGWGYVQKNTQVQNTAGSVNRAFDILTQDDATDNFTARLHGIPWVTFHVCDNGLNLAGTFTKLVPDNKAIFMVEPDDDIFGYYECAEPVVEYDGAPGVARLGEYYYAVPKADPAQYQLHSLLNGLPILKTPAAVAYGSIAS